MVLFFIASTIFRENKDIDKKVFNTKMSKTAQESRDIEEEPSLTSKIKLMDKPYK
jgi:hypothetical protein